METGFELVGLIILVGASLGMKLYRVIHGERWIANSEDRDNLHVAGFLLVWLAVVVLTMAG